MNELIVSQRIRKRHQPFRAPALRKIDAERKRFHPAGLFHLQIRTLCSSLLNKTPSLSLNRLSPWILPAVTAGITLLLLVMLLLSSVVAQARVTTLRYADDPVFEHDMRAYAGLRQIDAAETGDKPPLELAETFKFELYTVKPGESLSSIAAKNSLSLGSIIAANGINNAKRIHTGTVLKIPNMDGLPYVVRKGDTLSRIAVSNGIPVEAILDANDLSSDGIYPGMSLFLPGARMSGNELRRALGDLFSYPIRGILTSVFGWRNDPFTGVRRFHAAIDLAAPIGTPVHAALEGRIAVVGYNSVYGKYIIVTHDGGYQTWYAHLNEYHAEKGIFVKQGQLIGDVGSTGYSTGSHLHFAVFKNGRALNPLPLLTGR